MAIVTCMVKLPLALMKNETQALDTQDIYFQFCNLLF
jgi:hypothetical protein